MQTIVYISLLVLGSISIMHPETNETAAWGSLGIIHFSAIALGLRWGAPIGRFMKEEEKRQKRNN